MFIDDAMSIHCVMFKNVDGMPIANYRECCMPHYSVYESYVRLFTFLYL